jgi:hypothetical protein
VRSTRKPNPPLPIPEMYSRRWDITLRLLFSSIYGASIAALRKPQNHSKRRQHIATRHNLWPFTILLFILYIYLVIERPQPSTRLCTVLSSVEPSVAPYDRQRQQSPLPPISPHCRSYRLLTHQVCSTRLKPSLLASGLMSILPFQLDKCIVRCGMNIYEGRIRVQAEL